MLLAGVLGILWPDWQARTVFISLLRTSRPKECIHWLNVWTNPIISDLAGELSSSPYLSEASRHHLALTEFRRTPLYSLNTMDSTTPNYRHIERHVTCPFDNSHSILPERLLKHIRKCRKNNEILAESMLICPFSSVHYLKPDDYDEHVKNCYRQHVLMKWFPNLRY